ncbi:hypothetical protein HBE96_21250 [Clostridium sp. P21]|uniref:Plasmid-related protein n=1 Tax=Clostridium muellerianum TaxID=2716538 RepID=A0A7Y0HQG9_9CLOT|nr:hypothetical protein [Clostridium muellerianum]NMM65115.1 hypothetical protein [Clostridium muellerianum]
MENKILELLNQLVDGQDKTNDKLDRIEKKIDSVIEQTADLTEFRTETKDKLESIDSEVKGIRKDLNAVEIVTSKNWNDIATLKAVK